MSEAGYFHHSVPMSVGDAALLGAAELLTPQYSGVTITGMASLESAGKGDLAYIAGAAFPHERATGKAAAVICTRECAATVPEGIAVLAAKIPKDTFAQIGRALFPSSLKAEIFGEAFVDPSANIEAGAIISPGAVIGAGAGIGQGTVIGPHAVIGPNCQIGRNCSIGAGATVTNSLVGNDVMLHAGCRIGQDGFGFVPVNGKLEKVPHIGRVIIQDRVEIGANTTVDRGMLDDTVIGEGTKIDNLVQIGHNVRIGRHCVLAALTGISGSVTIGDWVQIGGASGIADHVTIGDGAKLAAQSGVMNNVGAGERWGGSPAQPVKAWFREIAVVRLMAKENRGQKK